MAVDVGVAVAGEVLGDRHHAVLGVGVGLGQHHLRHRVRVGAEGADTDHRVVRVGVDVGVGGVVEVDPHRGELVRRGGRAQGGEFGVAGGADRHRVGEQGSHRHAHDAPLFLVDAEEQRDPLSLFGGDLLDPGRHPGDLLGVVEVGVEVDEPAGVVGLDQRGVLLGRGALRGQDQELADLVVQVHLGEQPRSQDRLEGLGRGARVLFVVLRRGTHLLGGRGTCTDHQGQACADRDQGARFHWGFISDGTLVAAGDYPVRASGGGHPRAVRALRLRSRRRGPPHSSPRRPRVRSGCRRRRPGPPPAPRRVCRGRRPAPATIRSPGRPRRPRCPPRPGA